MCLGNTIKNFFLPCPALELPVVQHGANTPVSWSYAENTQAKDSFGWAGDDV